MKGLSNLDIEIASAADAETILALQKVSYLTEAENYQFIQSYMAPEPGVWLLGASGLAAKMKLILVDSLPDALRTLAEGKGDAALMPKLVGLMIMKKLDLTNLDPSPIVIDAYDRPFSFAVKDGNQALLERLSQGLSIIKSTGQYQEIYKRWFGALESPGLSWATVIKYIGAILAVFLLIGSGLFLWTVSLRKQVSSRTKNLASELQERKRAEEALQESEGRYRVLVENARDIVFRTDETGHLTFVNPAALHITGYEEKEIIGRHYPTLIRQDMREEAIKFFGRQFVKGIPNTYSEYPVIVKDGREIWFGQNTQLILQDGKVVGFQAVARDITDLRRIEEALRESESRYRELSIVDDLTQLYNSRHFYFQLKIELDRSNRYEQPLTLLLLDLDNFKAFNDAYGHVEGDQVLRRLGQVVKRCLRETDFAYRYGGEEFTVLLPMTTSADGAVTAERIRTEFKKEIFSPAPGQEVHVTVSIGLAQYKAQEEMKAFVHRVDQFMYQGKKSGKDRVCSES